MLRKPPFQSLPCVSLPLSITLFSRGLARLEKLHAEKCFLNLVKSNRNQMVFTILRLILNQTDFRFVPSQSENGKYDLWSSINAKLMIQMHNLRTSYHRPIVEEILSNQTQIRLYLLFS